MHNDILIVILTIFSLSWTIIILSRFLLMCRSNEVGVRKIFDVIKILFLSVINTCNLITADICQNQKMYQLRHFFDIVIGVSCIYTSANSVTFGLIFNIVGIIFSIYVHIILKIILKRT